MAILRATLSGSHWGQTIQTVMHFDKTDYVTADLSALATSLQSDLMNAWKVSLPSEFLWLNINVRPFFGSLDPAHNVAVSVAGTAGSSSAALPTSCVLFRLQGTISGRHGRGFLYFPGLGPACINAGFITNACLTVYQARCNDLLTFYGPTGSTDFTIVIADRVNLGDKVSVVSITPRPTPSNQRRRRIGVGI